MSLKDIEKLKERVDKDPGSKLFVPLAEEYRKEGMLDEAIAVLLKGVEKQPAYMSARVSLGKIYLEKQMLNEAKAEFEDVVRSIPDNLYAQKKLAEIYRDTGQTEMAIRYYRTVLKLNAMDEEAVASLRDLQGPAQKEASPSVSQVVGQSVEEVESAGVYQQEEESAVEVPIDFGPLAEPIHDDDIPALAVNEAESTLSGQEADGAGSEDELNAFKDSLFGVAEAETEISNEISINEDDTFEVLEEKEDEPGYDISFDDLNEALNAEVPVSAHVAEEIPAGQAEEEFSFAEDISFEEDVPAAADFISPTSPPGRQVPAIEEAERKIAEGNYVGAMNVYRAALSSDPGDRRILQRVEELRALLKLLGKDKDALINSLNAFLEGVQKRRDEFLGSS